MKVNNIISTPYTAKYREAWFCVSLLVNSLQNLIGEEGMFKIDEVSVGVNGSSNVKRVKPVVISKNKSMKNENQNNNNENLSKIKKRLGKLLDLEEKLVNVYSLED